jgi:hypothetical protein
MAIRDFGSRMHILNWVEGHGGDLVTTLNEMLQPTGVLVSPCSFWMPISRNQPDEAVPFRSCPKLFDPTISAAGLSWWLADPHPDAQTPNIDFAATATFPDGRAGLVFAEAKAHVDELRNEAGGKRPGSVRNHESIGAGIEQAKAWLGGDANGVRISRDARYQFANRLAMSCFLAKHDIPVVLIYLGFTGDAGVGTAFRDLRDWRDQVLDHTRDFFPASWWDNQIPWSGAPLWTLIRCLPCLRQTPPIAVRRSRATVAQPRNSHQIISDIG